MISKVMVSIMFLFSGISFASYNCDTIINNQDTMVTCTTVTKNGVIIAIRSFLNGKRNGVTKEWFKNGQLKYFRKFRSGCAMDTSFEYHKNGNIKRITPYKECVREGEFILLSVNGDTLAKGSAHKGKSIGTHYAWWSKNKPKFKVHYNSSGQKHGLSEAWRDDGTRKDSIVYENGDIIEFREYFENGKMRCHRTQKPVNKDINAVYYDPDGKKSGAVKNGNGTYIYYSDDGKSARKIFFENSEVIKSEKVDNKE